MSSEPKFKAGDIVRYTGAFLRSIGWYTPPINGKVTARSDLVEVEWSNWHTSIVNPANIELDPRVK